MPFQPLASQMKFGAAAQATSRTLCAEKRQVRVAPAPAGRADGCPTSVFAMIATVESECSARARRGRGWAGGNLGGLGRRAGTATLKPPGTVIGKQCLPH